jgi:hypothetical protein
LSLQAVGVALEGTFAATSLRYAASSNPVSPMGKTDTAETKPREGSLCRIRLCQNKRLLKAPSLARRGDWM